MSGEGILKDICSLSHASRRVFCCKTRSFLLICCLILNLGMGVDKKGKRSNLGFRSRNEWRRNSEIRVHKDFCFLLQARRAETGSRLQNAARFSVEEAGETLAWVGSVTGAPLGGVAEEEDVTTALRDGTTLCALAEALGSPPIKYCKTPRMPFHMVSSLLCLPPSRWIPKNSSEAYKAYMVPVFVDSAFASSGGCLLSPAPEPDAPALLTAP